MKIQDVIKGLQQPLSVPQDVDFRVGMSKSSGVSVLAYKDARVDMRRLDEVTNGQWQADYERDPKGTLKCGISIYVEMHDGTMQWLRKVSNGTESNTEQEKGHGAKPLDSGEEATVGLRGPEPPAAERSENGGDRNEVEHTGIGGGADEVEWVDDAQRASGGGGQEEQHRAKRTDHVGGRDTDRRFAGD